MQRSISLYLPHFLPTPSRHGSPHWHLSLWSPMVHSVTHMTPLPMGSLSSSPTTLHHQPYPPAFCPLCLPNSFLPQEPLHPDHSIPIGSHTVSAQMPTPHPMQRSLPPTLASHPPALMSSQHLSLASMIQFLCGFLVYSPSLFPPFPSLPPNSESCQRRVLTCLAYYTSRPWWLLTIYLLNSLNKIIVKLTLYNKTSRPALVLKYFNWFSWRHQWNVIN